jgi:hypothetical protein
VEREHVDADSDPYSTGAVSSNALMRSGEDFSCGCDCGRGNWWCMEDKSNTLFFTAGGLVIILYIGQAKTKGLQAVQAKYEIIL